MQILDQYLFHVILNRSSKDSCTKDCLRKLSLEISTFWYTHYNFLFRQRHSNIYVLINLTERTRQTLDEVSFHCGIFADLKRVFDTVDH